MRRRKGDSFRRASTSSISCISKKPTASEQKLQRRLRADLLRRFSVPENSNRLVADQSNLLAFYLQQAAFAQTDNVTVVIDLNEFKQTFFARLTLMAFGVRVEIVR